MSLRVRLSILITLLFAMVFIGAGVFVIHNARSAVNEEIEASANHTLQLIEVLLDSVDLSAQHGLQQIVLENLSRLESTRHLQISVLHFGGKDQKIQYKPGPVRGKPAPAWFVRLVHPDPVQLQRTLSVADNSNIEVIVHADPSDEIREVWFETRSVLYFLLLFIILANILLYFALGRYLLPIESILDGLENIEQGDYHSRLPLYELPELRRISSKFNHMADVLLESREENRRLRQKTLAIQEKERRYLAQELHDELGQSLSAIKAVAMSIEHKAASGNEAIVESAQAIGKFSERMYEVARNMMQRLRPSVLDELGLLLALQEMIDDWNDRHSDIFCYFECNDSLKMLDEDKAINLYRIIQESLTNVVKHAHAEKVYVKVIRDRDHLKVAIYDDGVGCDLSPALLGLGLIGMQERVEAINGEIEISSMAGKGVQINIVISLDKITKVSED